MVELSDQEQAVLNAAFMRVQKATAEARSLQQAAEQMMRKAESAGHEARGVFRSIVELRGRTIEEVELTWDGTTAVVSEKAPSPMDDPEANRSSADR